MTTRYFRAPGRVNLIGEHTDYNAGFVMPAALPFACCAAITPREDRVLAIHSENFGERAEFSLDDPDPQPRKDWTDYVRGVAVMLQRDGHTLRGADLRLNSDVPIGAGLSSSAAIEVATGFSLLSIASANEIDRVKLALACQRAENEFVGMRCGIMDQYISCLGKEAHALMIDCRSLEYRLAPLSPELELVIADTRVKHELASGEYNVRRAQCEEGARAIGVATLRDATLLMLENAKGRMSEVVYRRCRHVISENRRVTQAVDALAAADFASFGKLMNASHASLRDDYEVSCAELDALVVAAQALPGVYGARMTGGGFGGATVNLVEKQYAEQVAKQLEAHAIKPKVFVCAASDGAREDGAC
jgi:galactokinase